jgi:hypothetical protein
MSIWWKMAVFIEKPTVTSSNCYETMKNASILIKLNASILIKLGTNVDWTIAFVTTLFVCFGFYVTSTQYRSYRDVPCSVLNFLLPWQRGDISKMPIITILPWFFPSKFISKCYNFSRDWDSVKGFSALVTRYRRIDLGSFLASQKSKIFLAMRGTSPPSNPISGNHLMYVLDGGRHRKSAHFFLQHFSNMCWGLK